MPFLLGIPTRAVMVPELAIGALGAAKKLYRSTLPASHHSCLGSITGQVMWNLWWAKWHWGRFSPGTSVPHPRSILIPHSLTTLPLMTLVSILTASLNKQLKKTEQKILNSMNNLE
jgi:hypothetical protein